jgi:hypothetical protein
MTASTTKKYYKIQHSKNTNTLKFVLKEQPAPKTTRNNREKKMGKKNNKEQATLEARLSSDDIVSFSRSTLNKAYEAFNNAFDTSFSKFNFFVHI